MTVRRAFVFPGQGAQFSGMGKELAESCAASRAVFDRADRALGSPISELCFQGSEEDLAKTANTQPAILTMSLAALAALAEHGITATAAAGHSLGEYSAYVAAGSIPLEDAVRTVRRRGELMQEAVPLGRGAMAAILGLTVEQVAEVCSAAAAGQVVRAANLNSPTQVVIAGDAEAVERAIAGAKEAGARRAIPLNVSAPFHCSLMQPAAEGLAPVLQEVAFRAPSFPVYTNVDARPVTDADGARDGLLRQVASPVRWVDIVERMVADGIEEFVEIGPGKVLSGLIRATHRGARLFQVQDPASLEKTVNALRNAEASE